MDYDNLKNQLNQQNIRTHLEFLASFDKLSGSAGANRAAQYIVDSLTNWGIDCHLEEFTGFVSNPGPARLVAKSEALQTELEIPARPRSFSRETQGLIGELMLDDEDKEQAVEFDGKIVVSTGFDERKEKQYERAGAQAWIQVWESGEELLHEDTVSGVWGTPTTDSALLLPTIPVLGISRSSHEQLKMLMAAGPVSLWLKAELEEQAAVLKMPAAHINGATDDFLLLSCHYDTWYQGAFDNCAANAVLLEIARVLGQNQGALKRSVRLLWWSGHSNGRYAGSTWYCDNHFRELKEHCFSHITADLLGCRGCHTVSVRSAGTEGRDFLEQIIHTVEPGVAIDRHPLGRGADQSFWGAEIPIQCYLRYERPAVEKDSSSPGPGVVWWHTAEDTVDKVDWEVLRKDSEILCLTAWTLLTANTLPSALGELLNDVQVMLKQRLPQIQQEELGVVLQLFTQLERKLMRGQGQGDAWDHDKLMKLVGGRLSRLLYSWGSPYEQDLAFAATGPLAKLLQAAAGETDNALTDIEKLFCRTDFVRQKNRLETELARLMEDLDRQIESLI